MAGGRHRRRARLLRALKGQQEAPLAPPWQRWAAELESSWRAGGDPDPSLVLRQDGGPVVLDLRLAQHLAPPGEGFKLNLNAEAFVPQARIETQEGEKVFEVPQVHKHYEVVEVPQGRIETQGVERAFEEKRIVEAPQVQIQAAGRIETQDVEKAVEGKIVEVPHVQIQAAEEARVKKQDVEKAVEVTQMQIQAAVRIEKHDVEERLYLQKSRLLRFRDGEWKERGEGEAKLLKHRHTGKVRFLFKVGREIVANHRIIDSTLRLHRVGSDFRGIWKAVEVWNFEEFALSFSSKEFAREFKAVFDGAQAAELAAAEQSSEEEDDLP